MSMVFRFRMLSDENDNFVRDYEVLYDTTLLEFHDFILRSLEYEECMASFFKIAEGKVRVENGKTIITE